MQPTDEKSNQPVHPSRETRLSRLASEKSPYLLDHADNPVDWYPWSPEAFQKARDEDKPIFLSIGYSSCHWCQVMEEESFMDREVAELLNKYFVSIKVDREERPDIDAIYMSVCQVLTGGGGWPLTVLLTPDTKPFFAGTYFPKRGLLGRPGLMDILQQVAALWENRRERLLRAADEITGAMQSIPSAWPGDQLDEDTLREACRELEAEFDREHGGFGQAPKFPTAHILLFLLRWWKRTGESESLAMVEKTLSAMHRGGIYDHLGFGFHRYSTDDTWHVPHFEKMLYDQAMLALAYVETYQATGKDFYARIATEVFEYVMREMAAPNGGFYSSENADSEGEEGRFYVWSLEEIKDILGEERGGIFCRFYNVTSEGNFEDGLNILYVDGSVEDFVREGISRVDLEEILRQARKDLLGVRNKRVRPSKDDKILTDWNGLMIAALARGAGVLDRRAYAKAAAEAADFLLERLRGKDGRLMHRYRDGDAAVPGFIDDYAFLTWGLIELYEATFEVKYLREAIRLTDEMLEIFWDEESGGFYFTGEDSEKLIVRTKDIFDAAIPSGNSVAALNLLRLARMTARSDLEERADRLMEVFSGAVDRSPSDCAQLLVALDFALGPTKEIVIAGEPADRRVDEMVRAVWGRFLPRKVLLFHPAGRAGEAIEEIAPFTKNQVPVGDAPTAYVCENYTCKLPVTDVSRLVSVLEEP